MTEEYKKVDPELVRLDDKRLELEEKKLNQNQQGMEVQARVQAVTFVMQMMQIGALASSNVETITEKAKKLSEFMVEGKVSAIMKVGG